MPATTKPRRKAKHAPRKPKDPTLTRFHGRGGYPGKNAEANATLEKGKQYRIIGGSIGGCHTTLYLKGVPGGFNSVMFDVDVHKLVAVMPAINTYRQRAIKSITLTVLEILDLAKATGIKTEGSEYEIDKDEQESEYTITEAKGGSEVGDEDGKNPKRYKHTTYITEYPEEGTYPLGKPIA